MKMSDGELLEIFEADPQQGMVLLIEQYTGLIWHVVSHYLSNPEDVKECVNDTFADFFIHRDRFHKEKGTLANFLGTIARNHAVSRYRKESVRKTQSISGTLEDSESMISRLEERIDLEKALKELREDEFEIIRMKYYEGMSVGEIAKQMHLPYETVKKRHQRSISKLRRFMLFVLAVLLAALLTACALNILRYYGIIPGYGVNKDVNIKVYELKESVSVENDDLKLELTKGVLLNGDLLLKGTLTAKNCVLTELWENGYMQSLSEKEKAPTLHYGSEAFSVPVSGIGIDEYTKQFEIFLEDMEFAETDAEILVVYSTYGLQAEFELVMIESETLAKYPLSVSDEGGLLAIPEMRNEELILSIYPLNTGKYEIVPALVRDAFGQNKTGDVTISSEEGTVLTGNCINYTPVSYSAFYEWNFGQAEPGTYTLTVPYLFLKETLEEPVELMVDLNSLSYDSESYPIPEGTMKIRSCERAETEVVKNKITQESIVYHKWKLEIQVQMDSEEFELTQLLIDISMPVTGDISTLKSRGISHVGTSEDGIMQYEIRVPEEGYDISQCKITLGTASGAAPICLRWNQEHQMEICWQ